MGETARIGISARIVLTDVLLLPQTVMISGIPLRRRAFRLVLVLLGLQLAVPLPSLHAQDPDFILPPVPGSQPSADAPLSASKRKTLERELRAQLKRKPDDERALAGLAALLVQDKRYQAAISFVRGAHVRDPSNMKVAMLLGQLYLHAGLVCAAVDQFEWVECRNPNYPDLRYWLSTAYLRARWPLRAYHTLCCRGPVSDPSVRSAETLLCGSALAGLGLRREANWLFDNVRQTTGNKQLARQAAKFQRQLDEALADRERFQGVVSVTGRHDDNPGLIPTTNLFGQSTPRNRTYGNSFNGLFAYDLIRGDNFDLLGGYNISHTRNYEARQFNILNNAAFLAATQRGLVGDLPYTAALRFDYDYLTVGDNSFLQRFGVTPAVTLQDTDWTSTTLLARFTLLDFLRQGALDGTVLDTDSENYGAGVFQNWQLLCGDLTLQAGYLFDHNNSQGGNFDYNGHRVQLGMNWLTPVRDVQFSLIGSYYRRGYSNRDVFFGERRNDNQYTLQAFLLCPLRERWFLTFGWSLDRNDSSFASGDYLRQTFDIGLQYNFGGADAFTRRRLTERNLTGDN